MPKVVPEPAKAAREAGRSGRKPPAKAAKKARDEGRQEGRPTAAKKAARGRPRRRRRRNRRRGLRSRERRRAPGPKARQQPESLRLRSAGPSFTVNDIEKSLAFYRDVLGFTVKERWEQDGALHGVELVAGSVSFWLGQDDWQKGRDRVKGQGFRIYCGTSQDVDAIADRIRAAGGTLLEEPKDQPWGGRDFAVVDPDGFTITISSGL